MHLKIKFWTTKNRSKLNLEQLLGFVTPWIMHLLALCLVPDIWKNKWRYFWQYKAKVHLQEVGLFYQLHVSVTLWYKFLEVNIYLDKLFEQLTFPVRRSHRRPSGSGSPSGFAAGSNFWHSGMDKPLKRIPWKYDTPNPLLYSYKSYRPEIIMYIKHINLKTDISQQIASLGINQKDCIPHQGQVEMFPTIALSFLSFHQVPSQC